MDIQQIIKDRFKELPADIKQAIRSVDLATKFNTIANKHNLHIDQSGALQTETILVMLGLEPTDDYVDNLEKNLEISRDDAMSIAEDVNSEILDSIRESLRNFQEQSEQIQEREEDTETAGQAINTPSSTPTSTPSATISSLEKAGGFEIEKPEPANTSPLYKETGLKREDILKGIEADSIPMVDHLLSKPVNTPEKVVEKKTYSADPYREQV